MAAKAYLAWAVTVLALAAVALAVSPSQWDQTSYSDFNNGEVEQTVVSSLGEVKLAAASESLAELPPLTRVVYDVQPMPDGTLYVAVGPRGQLLALENGKLREVLNLPDEQIFSLDLLHGKLLLGISGPVSRLAVLEGKDLRTLVTLDAASLGQDPQLQTEPASSPDDTSSADSPAADASAQTEPSGVRYVWDVVVADRLAYLATGTPGRLLEVDLSAKKPAVRVLLKAPQNNLLCLGRDGHGRLYAGSDTDGLIYRVNPDGKEAYVLYDAAEPEIGALLVLEDGTVYAGTADAEQAASEAEGSGKGGDDSEGKPNSSETDEEPAPADEPAPDELGQADTAAASDEDQLPSPQAPEADASKHATAKSPDPQAQPPLPRFDPRALQAASADTETQTPAPTRQQLDQLRAEIRQRLEAARRSGALASSPSSGTRPSSKTRSLVSTAAGSSKSKNQPAASEEGNAIYRIDPHGFVTEIFREPVMVLRLLPDPLVSGAVLVATGNEGKIYRVGPESGEYAVLADLKVEQVPAMVLSKGKGPAAVVLGTANPAALLRLSDHFATEGQFVSEVHDAQQVSLWGTMQLVGKIPPHTSVTVQTRTGNVSDPQLGHWSEWAETRQAKAEDNGTLNPRWLEVQSPPGRFFQYRLSLTSDGAATPMVDRVCTTYITPNLRPKITTLTASYGDSKDKKTKNADKEQAPVATLTIEWEASDPNDDSLRYTLEYQADGWDLWLPLAKDLQDTTYQWDTRLAPDGWYLLRLTASDQTSNPPGMELAARHLSEPLLIDNTPPVFEQAPTVEVKGKQVVITTRVTDALSAIKTLEYAVDSGEQWRAVLPDDLLADSTQESFRVSIADLSVGAHVITLRAADSHDNRAYRSVQVRIPSKQDKR